ncbi:UNVERIFIED_CONTAM: hypothetical protein FKN15_030496 [Acipenser sinensis]
MKTKEHSKQVRDVIIEKHKSGEGYKTISKALNIPRSSVQSIVRKWKKYKTTTTLPRSGPPSKMSRRTRRAFLREATVRPTVTLNELQKSVAAMDDDVHVSTISKAFHKRAFMGERQGRSPG